MRISLLSIGAIASILSINSVFATTSTVTSKDYVDAADALKQNKIPAAGTNASTPGDTVVTYTQTGNGTIGERGIYDGASGHYDSYNDADKLVTAAALNDVSIKITGNLFNTTVSYKTCTDWIEGAAHTDANCLLWELDDKTVYGGCSSNEDCQWLDCPAGNSKICTRNHLCVCSMPA